MAYNSPFTPFGPTYLVGTAAEQVVVSNNVNPSSYRIANITSSLIHIAWLPPEPNNAAVAPTVTAPTTSVPQANTLAIPANGVSVIGGLPPNAWFISTAASSAEITPGEGIS
jgi:hypothetical protein